ncbi:ABC transporter substrate-binding protein [Oleiharenicola lentus]|uniref:ABC transporter substrate-binding protein n=1 Tax=Oleiharenicola lentus TaxID=2508720 RepID=UPI003F67C2E7
MKRALIILALVAIVGLPFVFRKKQVTIRNADETLVVITPHNEALRHEYTHGFREWYRAKTGKTIALDWRVIGGTSEITRFLESEYVSAFQNYWTRTLNRPWSIEVQAAFHNPRLTPDDTPADDTPEMAARRAFLESKISCGIDIFFGGGSFDFIRQANAGRLVDSGIMKLHPEWFKDDVIPQSFTGEPYWDKQGRWVGDVLSSYGMIYNRDALARIGITSEPRSWDDLENPKLQGEVALCDPTKSSSIAKAFENVIQQHIYRQWARLERETGKERKGLEKDAVAAGWASGLQLLQKAGANARYFTDTSQKPPIDVIQGNSAIGMCIDFYGRGSYQNTALRLDGSHGRVGYYSPPDGTVLSPDPIAVMRGSPNPSAALAFMEYALSMDGQKLWNFKTGTPGGTDRYELRRLPIRRDFYTSDFAQYRSDPDVNPYEGTNPLVYNGAWTGGIFREMAFVIRVMCLDTHTELVEAWRAIIKAGMPADAIAVMSDMSAVSYEEMNGRIKQALNSKNKVDEIRLANSLANQFRLQYVKAAEMARATQKAD